MYNFHGIYRYSPRYASNWRAVAAFFIGCIPPLPGFVDNIVQAGKGHTSVSIGGQHLYVLTSLPSKHKLIIPCSFSIGYVYSFVAAGVFYYGFNYFFPHPESKMDHAETGEDIIAENDAKNVEKAAETRKPGLAARMFQV